MFVINHILDNIFNILLLGWFLFNMSGSCITNNYIWMLIPCYWRVLLEHSKALACEVKLKVRVLLFASQRAHGITWYCLVSVRATKLQFCRSPFAPGYCNAVHIAARPPARTHKPCGKYVGIIM